MEVSYLNTYWDVAKFNLYFWSRRWFIRLIFVLYAVFYAYLFSTFDFVQSGEHSLVALVLTYLTMLVPQLLFITVVGLLGCLLVIPRGPSTTYYHRQRRIVLTEREVHEDTAVQRSQAAWSAVHRVAQNGAYIFIFVTEWSAHIIPKNAFVSPTKADEFFAYAYAHWQASKRH